MDCYREECPPLTACLHAEAIRPNPLACCKVCPKRDETLSSVSKVHSVLKSDPHKLNDMAMARTGLDILASGGCSWKGLYHENGVSWHPTVMPWGEMKCVTCKCKVSRKNYYEPTSPNCQLLSGWANQVQEKALSQINVFFTNSRPRSMLPSMCS